MSLSGKHSAEYEEWAEPQRDILELKAAYDVQAKLVSAVGRWIKATERNKKNSDVANYEEFARECMEAWDDVERAYKAGLEGK